MTAFILIVIILLVCGEVTVSSLLGISIFILIPVLILTGIILAVIFPQFLAGVVGILALAIVASTVLYLGERFYEKK